MFPLAIPLLAAGGAALATKLFNPSKGYKNAQKEQEKYYGQAQNYMQPYNQQGQEAYGPLSGAMNNLLNPMQLQNEWAQGYETSPYAQMLQEEAQNNGLNTAASMGLMGSTPAMAGIQRETSRIGAADRDKYMDDLMRKYTTGAQIAQGIYGQGGQTAGQMGQNAMNMGQSSAENAYNRQQAPGHMFSTLFGQALGFGGNMMMGNAMNNMANSWNTNGAHSVTGGVR